MWAHSLPYPHTSDLAPSTSAPAFSLWLQKRGQAWRDPFCMAGEGWEEATRKKKAKQRKSRKEEERRKEGRGRREKTQGKMRSEILVHSISLLNQVSIAMGPVHCQVSGESTGKWKCQGGYEVGAAGPVKWWAVRSKMNEWSPQGSSDHFLKESFFGFQDKTSCQWATASFPRGSPFLFTLFPSHHSYLPSQVFLIPAAGSLKRSQVKTCRGLSLASFFGRTDVSVSGTWANHSTYRTYFTSPAFPATSTSSVRIDAPSIQENAEQDIHSYTKHPLYLHHQTQHSPAVIYKELLISTDILWSVFSMAPLRKNRKSTETKVTKI